MADRSNPVVWFEIPVTDMARARAFYEQVLEIELTLHDVPPVRMAWFSLREGAMGATGSLVQGEMYAPGQAGTLVYFSVDDLDATLARATARGASVLQSRMNIGAQGCVAYFTDTEGNRVALHALR